MNFNPLDLLLFGILIYFAVNWFKRRGNGGRDDTKPGSQSPPMSPEDQRRQASDAYTRAQQAWNMLRSEDRKEDQPPVDVQDVDYVPGQNGHATQPSNVPSETLAHGEMPLAGTAPADLPADFDEADFMRGAKAFCVRIRNDWNNRDLNDLREFCTENGMEEFRRRAQIEARPPRHEIQRVDAGLVEVRDLPQGRRDASVYYEITEKDLSSNRVGTTREIWRFTSTPETSWQLDQVRPVNAGEGTRQ